MDEIKSTIQNITDSKLEVRTLQLDSQSWASELTIGVILEIANERLFDIVMSLSKTLNISVTDADVVKVERLGKKLRAINRNVIVMFNNPKHVDTVMSKIRNNAVKVAASVSNVQNLNAPVYIHPILYIYILRRWISFDLKFARRILP